MHFEQTLLYLSIAALAILFVSGLGLTNQSPWHKGWITLSLLHPISTAVLFATLAYHVHQELGTWPETIGTAGFSPGLVWHVELARYAFGSLLFLTLYVLPGASLVLQTSKKARPLARYVALYGLVALGTLVATYAAPELFVTWWWD